MAKKSYPNTSKPPQGSYAKVKIEMALPVRYWLDCKTRELVMEYSNGRIDRYETSDERFQEFVNEGAELRNM